MGKVKYLPNYKNEKKEDAYDLEIDFPLSRTYELAEEIGSDYHNNRGGWEDSWPMEFVVWWTGKEPFIVEVDRIDTPSFHLTSERIYEGD